MKLKRSLRAADALREHQSTAVVPPPLWHAQLESSCQPRTSLSLASTDSILVRNGLASLGYLLNTVDNGRRPRRGADKPAAAATDAISTSTSNCMLPLVICSICRCRSRRRKPAASKPGQHWRRCSSDWIRRCQPTPLLSDCSAAQGWQRVSTVPVCQMNCLRN